MSTAPAVAPFTLALAPGRGQFVAYTAGELWQGSATITPTISVVNPPRPSVVDIDCGNGTRIALGSFVGTQFFDCLFTTAGTWTVRATAETSAGWTTQANVAVSVVAPAQPPVVAPPPRWIPTIPIYYSLVESSATNTVFFSIQTMNAAYRHYWSFDDGETNTTALPSVQHRYAAPSREREVTVRVVNRDGVDIALGRVVGLW